MLLFVFGIILLLLLTSCKRELQHGSDQSTIILHAAVNGTLKSAKLEPS